MTTTSSSPMVINTGYACNIHGALKVLETLFLFTSFTSDFGQTSARPQGTDVCVLEPSGSGQPQPRSTECLVASLSPGSSPEGPVE
ncbi:hypothetical protein MTO96_020444 [Rhipicephalus appendiculatus]